MPAIAAPAGPVALSCELRAQSALDTAFGQEQALRCLFSHAGTFPHTLPGSRAHSIHPLQMRRSRHAGEANPFPAHLSLASGVVSIPSVPVARQKAWR